MSGRAPGPAGDGIVGESPVLRSLDHVNRVHPATQMAPIAAPIIVSESLFAAIQLSTSLVVAICSLKV